MLSNGSKPTSYGAGSGSIHSVNHNLLGKTTLSGMMGGNDHIWMSSRGAAGIPKGVRSETGSIHNVSNNNNNHPYQDNQSSRSKASMHSSMNKREIGGSTFGFSSQTFSLKTSKINVGSPEV